MEKSIGLLIQKISNQLKRKIEKEMQQETPLTTTQGMVFMLLSAQRARNNISKRY